MPVVPPKNLTAENLAKMAKESAPYLSHAEPLTARENAAAVDAYKKYINSIKDLTAGDINLSKISKKLQTELVHFSNSIKKLEEALSRGGHKVSPYLLGLKSEISPVLGAISQLETTSSRQKRPMFSALYNRAIISAAQKQQREHERIQKSQQIERERTQRRAARIAEIEQSREDNRNKRNETLEARRHQREVDRNNRQQVRDEAKAKIAEAKLFTQSLKEQQIIKNRDRRVVSYISRPTTDSMVDRHAGHAMIDLVGAAGAISSFRLMPILRHLGGHLGRVYRGYGGGGGRRIGGGGIGGGGGRMGPLGTFGTVAALGLDAIVAAGLGAGAAATLPYEAYLGMGPAANALEAITKAGRITGIPYRKVSQMYGGTRANLYQINPKLAALGITSPMQYADVLSAYGMPYRANTAVNYAIKASQAKYLGFMGAPEWAATQQRMLGGFGYGTGTMGIESMMVMFSDAIKKGLKGVVPPPQTFEGINKYLGMLAQTGQVMPMDRAIKLATQGITSANPALRNVLAQPAAGAAWSGMLSGVAGNPMQFTSLMSAVYRATGSTSLTSGNINKTLRSLGLPTHRFTRREAGVLNTMAAVNPVWPAIMLAPMGITGEILEKGNYKNFYVMAKNMGYSDIDAKNYAIGLTTMFTSGGTLAKTGTLNYFGVRAGAPRLITPALESWRRNIIKGTRMHVDPGAFPFATAIMKGSKLVNMTVPGTMPSTISPYNVPSTLAGYREAGALGLGAKLGASNIALDKFTDRVATAANELQDFINALSMWGAGPVGSGKPYSLLPPNPLGGVGSGASTSSTPPGVPALPTGGGSAPYIPPAVLYPGP